MSSKGSISGAGYWPVGIPRYLAGPFVGVRNMVKTWSQARPQDVAVVWAGGSLTWSALDMYLAEWHRWIMKEGPGISRIAVVADQPSQLALLLLAGIASDLWVLAVNASDPNGPAVASRFQADAVITDGPVSDRWTGWTVHRWEISQEDAEGFRVSGRHAVFVPRGIGDGYGFRVFCPA